MEFSLILGKQVLVMFLLLLIGMILYRLKMADDNGKRQMTNVMLYVVTPCLILNTYQMEYSSEMAKNMALAFFLSAGAIVAGIILSNLMRIRGKKESVPTERFCLIFTNCGFMGIPLANAVFGTVGVFYCTTFVTMFNLFCWTYGRALMVGKNENREKRSLKEILRPFCNTTIFAIILGIVLYFMPFRINTTIVGTALKFVADMNTPLAMIVSGIYIAQSDILGALKQLRVYYAVVLKCLAIPMVTLLLLALLPFDTTMKLSVLICSAAPTGANAMLFSNRFGGDSKTASHIFTLTTLFSVISIPLMILISSFIMPV